MSTNPPTAGATAGGPPPLLLRGASVAGRRVDVLLAGGHIAALGPDASRHPGAGHATVHDLHGHVLLPSAVEPHAHLDKAMLGDRCPNEAGDLAGAIEATRRAYASMDEADIRRRATAALTLAVRHGYSALRTHTLLDAGIGTRAVQTLCALRDEVSELVDLQIVAHVGMPVTGDEGITRRALLERAIDMGVDLVGGAPALDPSPVEAIALLVAAADHAGLPIDLHLDETTDARVFTLDAFATEVTRRNLGGRATASHCVSLGQQEPEKAAGTAARLAAAGIGVVTLPQTNLFLQGRGQPTRVLRGLTAVQVLRQAGVVVGAGGDNWRDPFNPLGRIDPFETAGLLVAAAHLSPADAYAAVSEAARRVMGLEPVALEAGSPADLLAVEASTIADAVAGAGSDRWVFRGGRLVARTRTVPEVDPAARLEGAAGG
jgi:cytosine deaminase